MYFLIEGLMREIVFWFDSNTKGTVLGSIRRKFSQFDSKKKVLIWFGVWKGRFGHQYHRCDIVVVVLIEIPQVNYELKSYSLWYLLDVLRGLKHSWWSGYYAGGGSPPRTPFDRTSKLINIFKIFFHGWEQHEILRGTEGFPMNGVSLLSNTTSK